MESPTVFNRSTSRDLRETFWDSDEKLVGLSLQRFSVTSEKAFANSPRASASEYFPSDKGSDSSSSLFVNIPISSREVASPRTGASSEKSHSSPGKKKALRHSRLSRCVSFSKKGQIGIAFIVLLVLAVQVGWIYQPFGRIEFTIRVFHSPTTRLLGGLGQLAHLQHTALSKSLDGPTDPSSNSILNDAGTVLQPTRTSTNTSSTGEEAEESIHDPAPTSSSLAKFFKHTFPQRQCDLARGTKLRSENALTAEEFGASKYLLIIPRGSSREQFTRLTRGLAWAKATARRLIVIPPIPSQDEIWSEEHCWVEKYLQKKLDVDWSDLLTLSDSDFHVPMTAVVRHLPAVVPCLSDPADHSIVEDRSLQYFGLRVAKADVATSPVTTAAFAEWIKAGESQRVLCADFVAKPDAEALIKIGSMITLSPAIEKAADEFIAQNFGGAGQFFLGLHVWRSEEFGRICSDLKKCGRSMKQIYQVVRAALDGKDPLTAVSTGHVYVLTESQRSALERMKKQGWKRYTQDGSHEPSPAAERSGDPAPKPPAASSGAPSSAETPEALSESAYQPSGPGPYSHALVEVAVVTRASLFIADPDATLSLLVAGRRQVHGGRVAFLQPQKSQS